MNVPTPTSPRSKRRLSDDANYTIDPSFDKFQCRSEQVSDFLLIRRMNCRLEENLCGYVEGTGVTCMSIFINAHGSLEFDSQHRLAIEPNTIMITQGSFCAFELRMGTQLNLLEFLFDTRVLLQQGFDLFKAESDVFAGRISKDNSISVSKTLSPHSIELVNSIIQCKTEDITGKLRLQAKALELLSENMRSNNTPKKARIIESIDQSKITKATEIIEQSYNEPLTIKALSKAVGLNEKKLKDGFREILGTTVHNYIENVRLHTARNLLEEGKKITETALEVGYASPSHFAKRFQKNFGQTPKSWQMTMDAIH
ncbi:helix-turn-helix transcriptional regulator [Marinomonas transparens]|uniref:Helix-turn-helix transcriptional regulator n=1 Tax=Marinomonas transparens TaxID=2795388 RepID=A0A934JX91_9GAMM|nr:AraC family transcriptional regulator [Marinomonas transparens]MBJ7538955.1 helix-turn-helix transcriptional regulator [Marinomonas transparens]